MRMKGNKGDVNFRDNVFEVLKLSGINQTELQDVRARDSYTMTSQSTMISLVWKLLTSSGTAWHFEARGNHLPVGIKKETLPPDSS